MNPTTTTKSITFTVDGERYARLERAARAMNKTSWCCHDNTPETVFTNFVITGAEILLDSYDELCEDLLAGIATSDDGLDTAPEPIHAARIAELRNAFDNL